MRLRIDAARKEGEARALETMRTRSGNAESLCATPYGIDIVGITEGVALAGALVGGLSARNKKAEVEALNERLRSINVQLRAQARAGTTYAPGLSYAPTGGATPASSPAPVAEASTASAAPVEPADSAAPAAAATPAASPEPPFPPGGSVSSGPPEVELKEKAEKEPSPLSLGRSLLKENKGSAALVQFEKARMLSRADGDKTRERRAERGLAAASRMQKQYRKALNHLERVLEISGEMGDTTGDSDACGTIADIYTEMGELEEAAKYYDKYIQMMSDDC